ncbi:phage major capsid protein [Nocardia paucivorans]|uniref:phage major capsid protein n=1 Tax=Nocardia paucivorans TaxID=114259 RepID=UPI0002D4B96A|nr:phage major capsid protein [Nocardia paucivorans]
MLTLREARAELAELRTESEELLRRGEDLLDDDARRFDEIVTRAAELKDFISRTEARIETAKRVAVTDPSRLVPGDDRSRPFDDHRPAPALRGAQTLGRDQSMSQWVRDNGHAEPGSETVSFDRYVRGLVTGDWRHAPYERALAEGTMSAGGYTVPMTSQTLRIPRLEGEGAPAWRNENAAVAEGDLVFGQVTLTARSLTRLVKISRELFEDSDPSVSQVVSNAFAAQIALELDRVALRGSGTAPEPRGVLNTAGVALTGHGANGTVINTYDWLLDSVGAVRSNNFEPSAVITAPRTLTTLSKLKDAQNAYLAPPSGLPPLLPTKQVPTNLTVGTSTDASEIYTGQWNQLAIGIRTGFTLEVLTERYADNMQLGFLAHIRADVAVLQPGAFVVDTGVR